MNPDFFETNRSLLQKQRGLIFFEGCLFILLGCMAIATPQIFTLATDFVLGLLFVTAGIVQLYRSIKTWGIEGTWAALFSSLLALPAGAVLLGRPMIGILALTTILSIYF